MIYVRYVNKRGNSQSYLVVDIGFVRNVLFRDVKTICYVMFVIVILKACFRMILINTVY